MEGFSHTDENEVLASEEVAPSEIAIPEAEEKLTTAEIANQALNIIKQQHGIHKKIGELTRAGLLEEAKQLSSEDDRLNEQIEAMPAVAITIALNQIRKDRQKQPERYENHYAKQREELARKNALEARDFHAKKYREQIGQTYPENEEDIKRYFAERRARQMENRGGYEVDEWGDEELGNATDYKNQEIDSGDSEPTVMPKQKRKGIIGRFFGSNRKNKKDAA